MPAFYFPAKIGGRNSRGFGRILPGYSIFAGTSLLARTVYLMPKAPCVCVYSDIFSETTRPTETKFHVEPLWDMGRKFIQMVRAICCSFLSTSLGAGALAGILQ